MPPKEFTTQDVEIVKPYGDERQYLRISANREELIDAPMWYHTKGLSQTASGFGRKLNTGLKIRFNGRDYRVYCTCFSNSGTCWFISKGQEIVVD